MHAHSHACSPRLLPTTRLARDTHHGDVPLAVGQLGVQIDLLKFRPHRQRAIRMHPSQVSDVADLGVERVLSCHTKGQGAIFLLCFDQEVGW